MPGCRKEVKTMEHLMLSDLLEHMMKTNIHAYVQKDEFPAQECLEIHADNLMLRYLNIEARVSLMTAGCQELALWLYVEDGEYNLLRAKIQNQTLKGKVHTR